MATENINIKATLDTKQFDSSLKGMQQELKNLKGQLGNNLLSDADRQKILERYGTVKNEIRELQQEIRNVGDASNIFGDVATLMTPLAGAFTAAGSALSLMGVENEKVNEILQKTSQITIGLMALQQVADANKLKSLLTYRVEQIKNFALDKLTIKNRQQEVAANLAVAASQGKITIATKIATAAQKLWNKAIAANPIGILLVAITALIGAITLLATVFKKTTDEVEDYEKALDGTVIKNEELRNSHNEQIKELRKLEREYRVLTGEITENEAAVESLYDEYTYGLMEIEQETSVALDNIEVKYKNVFQRIWGWIQQFTSGINQEYMKQWMEGAVEVFEEENLKITDLQKKQNQKILNETEKLQNETENINSEIANAKIANDRKVLEKVRENINKEIEARIAANDRIIAAYKELYVFIDEFVFENMAEGISKEQEKIRRQFRSTRNEAIEGFNKIIEAAKEVEKSGADLGRLKLYDEKSLAVLEAEIRQINEDIQVSIKRQTEYTENYNKVFESGIKYSEQYAEAANKILEIEKKKGLEFSKSVPDKKLISQYDSQIAQLLEKQKVAQMGLNLDTQALASFQLEITKEQQNQVQLEIKAQDLLRERADREIENQQNLEQKTDTLDEQNKQIEDAIKLIGTLKDESGKLFFSIDDMNIIRENYDEFTKIIKKVQDNINNLEAIDIDTILSGELTPELESVFYRIISLFKYINTQEQQALDELKRNQIALNEELSKSLQDIIDQKLLLEKLFKDGIIPEKVKVKAELEFDKITNQFDIPPIEIDTKIERDILIKNAIDIQKTINGILGKFEEPPTKISKFYQEDLDNITTLFNNKKETIKQYYSSLYQAAEGNVDKQKEITDRMVAELATADSEYQGAVEVITNKSAELKETIKQDLIDLATTLGQSISKIFSDNLVLRFDTLNKQLETETNNALDLQQQLLDQGLISQEQYNENIEKINEDVAEKEYDIKIKQAKADKQLALFQIAIDTAIGIAKSWGQGGGLFGLPLAAIVAMQGAIQAAAVAAQPLPVYQQGGIVEAEQGRVLKGKSHKQGGVIVEAEGGEIILNKNVSKHPELKKIVSEINYITGGKKFETGGLVEKMAIGGLVNSLTTEKLYTSNNYITTNNNMDEKTIRKIITETVAGISKIPVINVESEYTGVQRKVANIQARASW